MRKNGQTITAAWFNEVLQKLSENEAKHELLDGAAATALVGQAFDGTKISSVVFEFEITRGAIIFANGRFSMQYKSGAWKWIDLGYGDEDGTPHGITFTIEQTGTIGQLKAAASSGPGDVKIKLKRKSFNANA